MKTCELENILKIICPNKKYIPINKIESNMKYITIRNYKKQCFIFLDECIHYGNVTTIIRKRGFIINDMNIDECLKEEISIHVDKSYFNNVEIYYIENTK
jgi:hypothetical protein